MSRTRNKTKIHGYTKATSEKRDKQIANRRLRRIVKQKLAFEDDNLPKLREISNVWDFSKDGKIYNPNMTERDLQK